jgi:RNA polymerase sigma-70 factor (ECF subfamily)
LAGEKFIKKFSKVNQPFLQNLRGNFSLNTELVIEDKALYRLLDACRKGDRHSLDRLYKEYYGYSMGICLRYSRTREEATEILNDGFFKIFRKLDHYSPGLSFKGWLRKVMINSAVDYFRRNEKHYANLDISYVQYESDQANVLDTLSEKDILAAVQRLPESYRIVFNLFVIEGYKHEEIATMLNISVGTSKSNLSVARRKLKRILINVDDELKRREGHG